MASPLKITFLGGLGEIGRNCAAFEYEDQILLLDCGLMFPDHDMLGVDIVLPDFSWVHERADKIVGCVLTHGHEDHVGALSYLLPDVSFPLYGTEVTLGLAYPRIEENGLLGRTEFNEVRDGETHQIGPFSCQFFAMTHSVPQAVATAITTGQGTVLHSGDFKIDLTPVDGRLSDLSGIGAIATDPGIRLLLADSTNAGSSGLLGVGDRGGQGAVRPDAPLPGPTHRHRLLCLPHPPGAADRRCGDRVRPQGGNAGALDEAKRGDGARNGRAAHSR
jgi:ribonuclease J